MSALAVALYAVDLPLFAMGPGPTHEVGPLIDVDGTSTYPSSGRLLLTTVSVGRVGILGGVAGWLDPATEVVPEERVVPPNIADREHDAASLRQMDESKIAAIAVALEHETDYPAEHGRGALVQRVYPQTPAEGVLFAGDVILEVDGKPVTDASDLTETVRAAGTRRALTFAVEGEDRRRTVSIRPARLERESRPVIGVSVVENFPFDVSINSREVGGPSAGLMWAIGMIDLLSPGDLTRGRTLAGTGAISLDGTVSAIGGVEQKVRAAEDAGAEVFLVPRDNADAASEVARAIDVVPVGTVDDAVRHLEDRS